MSSHSTKDLRTIVAENIAAARKTKGLTQRELAARVNDVDQLAVSRWERGVALPLSENFEALAVALGQTVAWFYTEHPVKEAA